jgi:hypothetical protein
VRVEIDALGHVAIMIAPADQARRARVRRSKRTADDDREFIGSHRRRRYNSLADHAG